MSLRFLKFLHLKTLVVLIQFLALPILTSASGTLVIKNITVIDGTGNEPNKNSTVVIQDNMITSVSADYESSDDANVIDGSGWTVMPGIIDMHTHPTFEIRMKNPRLPFPDPDALPSSDSEMSEFIESRLPRRLKLFLERGVTTVVSAGSYWPYELNIQKRISQGELPGPRMLVSSPIFTAPGAEAGDAHAMVLLAETAPEAEARRLLTRAAALGHLHAERLLRRQGAASPTEPDEKGSLK